MKSNYYKELVAEKLLALCAYLTVLTTILIVYILLTESFQFFKTVSMAEFMFGTRWEPLLDPKSFGVLPLLFGTLMIVVGSAFVCIPIGLTTAIFLSQYASKKVRRIIKPVLEGKNIGSYDLLASENVKRQNIFSRLLTSINYLIWGDV